MAFGRESRENNADDKSIGPQGPQQAQAQVQVTCLGELALSTRRLHPGDDAHTQETQFGDEKSCQGAFDQWL